MADDVKHTQDEIEDIWYDCFYGDVWEREVREDGYAVIHTDDRDYDGVIVLVAEQRWRPCPETYVPSHLWDAGTPSAA